MNDKKRQDLIPIDIPIPGQMPGNSDIACEFEQLCSQLWLVKLQSLPVALDFDQLLDQTHLGRSGAYEKMQRKHANFDPYFPQGIPLYDSDRSPKTWWTHRVVAWLMKREASARLRA